MKVFHVIDSGGLYGAEMMLLSLAQEQLKLGIRPVIASIGENGEGSKAIEAEALARRIPFVPFRMKAGPNLIGGVRMARYAWQHAFSIIHSHGYKGNILLGLLPKALRRLPIVATAHGWTATPGFSKIVLYEKLDRFSLNFMDTVVVVNRSMKAKAGWMWINRKNMAVIENGILPQSQEAPAMGADKETSEPVSRIADFCRDGLVVGAVGRLSKEKGFTYLIEAFKQVKQLFDQAKLVVLGEGRQREELERLIDHHRLGRDILLAGYVKNARQFMDKFNVFVLPSLTEGLPITLLEAMQQRRPIVATRVGGIPTMIQDKTSGILVEPKSAEALAEGIVYVLQHPNLAASMTQEAYSVVERRFTSTAMAMNYLDVYRHVVLKSSQKGSSF